MKRYLHSLVTGALLTSLAAAPAFAAPSPELTVYNQNFALVKDYPTLTLQKGVSTVYLDNVAALIDPTSVHFKSLSHPTAVTIDEQNFRYDLINKSNILDRMVGQRIRFLKDKDVKEGILLNPSTAVVPSSRSQWNSGYPNTITNSEFAVKTTEGVLLTTLDSILIDSLPNGLYPRPTLMWQLRSTEGGSHNTEVSYLTGGVTWACDYVAVLDANDEKIDLTGWVTLDNQSGKTYENAKLKLVAGDVRKLQPENAPMPMMAAGAMMKSDVMQERAFSEESLFEYHLYSLNEPTTVANNETKQVSLVTANGIPVSRQYIFDPQPGYRTYGRSNTNSDKIKTIVRLQNTKANQLGIPLPKGKVRVYKADGSKALQFIGEDAIDHTATDEKVELYLGDAFDIVGEKITTQSRSSSSESEATYQVLLKNHKKSAVTIDVIEHPGGNWKIENASSSFTKLEAHKVKFAVNVPANGQTKLTYTILTKHP